MASMMNEVRRLGTRATYRSAARTSPFVRGRGGSRRSSAGRIIQSAAITTRYDAASMVKHHPKPAVTTRRPAERGAEDREMC